MKVRVASAGTGKTTSLVRRYLELISHGTPLRRIAGVTFTRSAAAQLRQRVAQGLCELQTTGHYYGLVPEEAAHERLAEAARELGGATLTTIHSFMADALRLVAPQLGLDPDFAIMGEWEARALFEEELSSLAYLAQPGHALYAHLNHFGESLSDLLVTLFTRRSLTESYRAASGDAGENKGGDEVRLLELFDAVYARYRVRLGSKRLTPSEVERYALRLARTPTALTRLAGRYRVLLVDEFQDVNPLQGRFFELLEASGIGLEVVGDPKQSIYAFRFAEVSVFRRALAQGEMQPPLSHSYRHAHVLTRFLNHLTRDFAERGQGFHPPEAPEVSCTRTDAAGRLELHWVSGEAKLDELRQHEASILASRLADLTARYPDQSVAVLARSHDSLRTAERALVAAGVPCVLQQGRGYFERLEVRDLYHALRVGVDPTGLSLAVWLRSPFADLALADVDHILQSDAPLARLETDFPTIHARLMLIRRVVREKTSLEALKYLVRASFIGGRRYVDFLAARERENVDALLFTVASHPPGGLELLLERLEQLSRQQDAGDVPQRGGGVTLLTIHAAKGLEWDTVALFDAARGAPPQHDRLYVSAEDGHVALKGSGRFDDLRAQDAARSQEEGYRLLYVALSRARNTLLVSGSIGSREPGDWVRAFERLEVGPGAREHNHPELVVKLHPYRPVAFNAPPQTPAPPTPPAWLDRHFPPLAYPPLYSPSALKQSDRQSDPQNDPQSNHEPLPLPDPSEGELLPGRARAVGTLVHYAISQNWQADNPVHLANLEAQEVMFAFDQAERQGILGEVRELLHSYQALLGHGVLWPRDDDYPELPMALPVGTTVWQGVIDRLYRVGKTWYLEDYKTDRVVSPEQYHFQLAVYHQAVCAVRGVSPQVRLVYLRNRTIVPVTAKQLERALETHDLDTLHDDLA